MQFYRARLIELGVPEDHPELDSILQQVERLFYSTARAILQQWRDDGLI